MSRRSFLDDTPCQHRAWRRWRITQRFATFLYVSGITAGGGGWSYGGRAGHRGCISMPAFNLHPRPYVLGISTDTWRCWSKGHRRGEEVGFGLCGKCMPWTCCGATTVAHADDCPEDA